MAQVSMTSRYGLTPVSGVNLTCAVFEDHFLWGWGWGKGRGVWTFSRHLEEEGDRKARLSPPPHS